MGPKSFRVFRQTGPWPDFIFGLSVLLTLALIRGFFSGFSGFPPSTKTNTSNSNSTNIEGPDENHSLGCCGFPSDCCSLCFYFMYFKCSAELISLFCNLFVPNLFYRPHKCPEPKYRYYAPSNMTTRLKRREVRRLFLSILTTALYCFFFFFYNKFK